MRRALVFVVLGVLPFGCFQSFEGFSGGGATADAGVEAAFTREAGADTSTPTSDPYRDAVLADGPTAYYRLDDAPGATTIADTMGAYPGTQKGVITFGVKGAVGNGATFAGEGGYFDIGDFFDFANTREFAIEFWAQNVNPTGRYETALHKRSGDQDPENGWVIFQDTSDNTLQFQFWSGGAVDEQVTTTAAVHGLHHVVIVRTVSGSTFSLAMYLDGVLQHSNDSGSQGGGPDTSAPLQIGVNWHGLLDEIALYQHPLTADRVRAHFNAAPKP